MDRSQEIIDTVQFPWQVLFTSVIALYLAAKVNESVAIPFDLFQ